MYKTVIENMMHTTQRHGMYREAIIVNVFNKSILKRINALL